MPSNYASIYPKVGEKLIVEESPFNKKPGPNEILVKNHAWAVNPADVYLQKTVLFEWLPYPCIGGCDIAGEVMEVGPNITDFKAGDRVLALCHSMDVTKKDYQRHKAGYQNYTIIEKVFATRIPDTLSYTDAATLPLGLCTAASGLFEKGWLALDLPKVDAKPNGKTILIWGASGSVGANAVQLAAAGGYEVFATASKKGFDAALALGASKVFDYNSPTVVEDIVGALQGKTFVGIESSAPVAVEQCLHIAAQVEGRKFVAFANPPPPEVQVDGVEYKFIWSTIIKQSNVASAVYNDFLPKALALGTYKIAPPALVVGPGLEHIQTGFEKYNEGVGAQKVVIEAAE